DVISDERTARNQDIAVDNRAAKPCVASYAHAGHQNRLLELAEAVHADVGTENAAHHATARNDAAAGNDRVERLAAAFSLRREYEFRGGRLRLIRTERPLRIVQVELRVHLAQVHAGVEIGIE